MTDQRQSLPAALLAAGELASRESRTPTANPATLAAALDTVCAPVFTGIRRSIGDDGCAALFSRAYARIEWEHPAARTIRSSTDCHIPLENLSAAIEAYGGTATAMAVDALLKTLHEILGRIIGEDMAKRIIDQEAARPASGNGTSGQ